MNIFIVIISILGIVSRIWRIFEHDALMRRTYELEHELAELKNNKEVL